MEFKPQIIPNKNIETENQPFSPEKFLDWDPFNNEVGDICFSVIDNEDREITNNRIHNLKKRVCRYLNSLNIDKADYDSAFEQIIKNDNKNDKLNKLGDLVAQITDALRIQLPEAEKIERQEWLDRMGIKAANQLIGYDKISSFSPNLYLHTLPNRTTAFRDKLALFKEGFQNIAKVVASDETVKKIVGESWIVSKHPEFIKNLGFRIVKSLDEEAKKIFKDKSKKESAYMAMDRDEFLKRYLVS